MNATETVVVVPFVNFPEPEGRREDRAAAGRLIEFLESRGLPTGLAVAMATAVQKNCTDADWVRRRLA